MKRRSRLRRRIREWLKKKKEQKKENPIPSFANRDESPSGSLGKTK
nr:hypothetical protein [Neobacillus sp. Marseille-Q6967]